MTEPIVVNIAQLIAKPFHEVLRDILLNRFTHYWLKGGRGSTKSSFCSLIILVLMLADPAANTVILRKVGNTLRNSVYAQILWAIEALGLSAYFRCTVSPMEMTYTPTGQKIVFLGLDDPEKAKGVKFVKGYAKVVWFEELSEFNGMEEIRKVLQTFMRGGTGFTVLYSYNPPITAVNWVNFEAAQNVPNRRVHSSSYLAVPKAWLGEDFLIEAEILKRTNPMAYRHEYLGEATGTGGTVFPNIISRRITDEELGHFDRFRYGIDWGFATDPFAWIELYYDKTRRTIYITDEIFQTRLHNADIIRLIKAKPRITRRDRIIADSEEPKSISELRRNGGFNMLAAKKGKGSVAHGFKFLQSMHAIIIDQQRTPNAWREFVRYEFEKDKNGEWINDFPDKMNHCIAEGQLVTTDKGHVSIENIRPGDMVLTRGGYKKVLKAWCAGENRETVEVIAGNKKLICTPDHEIYTANRDFVRADLLAPNDVLVTENDKWWKQPNITDTFLGAIQTAKEDRTGSILSVPLQKALFFYIAKFGQTIMAKSLKIVISTTKTVIAVITKLKIWNASTSQRTLIRISPKIAASKPVSTWTKFATLQKRGIAALKVLPSTEKSAHRLIKTLFQNLSCVRIAVMNFCQSNLVIKISFVQKHANPHGVVNPALTTKQEHALNAAKNLGLTSIREKSLALSPVQTVKKGKPAVRVYDLTVEGQHEFFASGILVSNCIDAVRYALERDNPMKVNEE